MKRLVVSVMLVLGMMGAVGARECRGEGPAVAGSASLDFMSNYVWRGEKLSNSWVLQPTVSITYGVLGATLWANYDSDRTETTSGSDSGHGEVTETDFTLSYTRTIDKFTVGGGYIYYAFDGANDTQEVYLTGTYNGLLNPTLAVYYDYDEGNGAYIMAAVSHVFTLPKDLSLKLGAYASYDLDNKVLGLDDDGDEVSAFYNAEISGALTIPLTKNISVTPKIAYSFALSSKAKEAISNVSNDRDHDVVYGGIGLALSF